MSLSLVEEKVEQNCRRVAILPASLRFTMIPKLTLLNEPDLPKLARQNKLEVENAEAVGVHAEAPHE